MAVFFAYQKTSNFAEKLHFESGDFLFYSCENKEELEKIKPCIEQALQTQLMHNKVVYTLGLFPTVDVKKLSEEEMNELGWYRREADYFILKKLFDEFKVSYVEETEDSVNYLILSAIDREIYFIFDDMGEISEFQIY